MHRTTNNGVFTLTDRRIYLWPAVDSIVTQYPLNPWAGIPDVKTAVIADRYDTGKNCTALPRLSKTGFIAFLRSKIIHLENLCYPCLAWLRGNGGVLGCSFWHKKRQLSMKACGRMRWRFGRQRRKGGIVCQGEMSDMRLSFSPWQGLEWPWLWSTESSKGEGWKGRQGRSCVEKGGWYHPSSFNQTGQ